MAPTRDDFRDLGWLLRILNRSLLEARYPRWRGTRGNGSGRYEDDSVADGEDDDEPRIVHATAAVADDAA